MLQNMTDTGFTLGLSAFSGLLVVMSFMAANVNVIRPIILRQYSNSNITLLQPSSNESFNSSAPHAVVIAYYDGLSLTNATRPNVVL